MFNILREVKVALAATYRSSYGLGSDADGDKAGASHLVVVDGESVDLNDALIGDYHGECEDEFQLGSIMAIRAASIARLLFGESLVPARFAHNGAGGIYFLDLDNKPVRSHTEPTDGFEGGFSPNVMPSISAWLAAHRSWDGILVPHDAKGEFGNDKLAGIPDLSSYVHSVMELLDLLPADTPVDIDLLTPAVVGELLDNKVPVGYMAATVLATLGSGSPDERSPAEIIGESVSRLNQNNPQAAPTN